MSIRRPNNPRLSTPDDTASGESDGPDYQQSPPVRGLQQRRMMGRTVARRENERRVTPEDHGGSSLGGDITIRKLRLSDGVEVWNNRRGTKDDFISDIPGAVESCRAIISEGDGRFVTFGTPVLTKHHSNGLRWTDIGTGAARGRRTRESVDYDCTFGHGVLGEGFRDYRSWGGNFAFEHLGLYWTCGTIDATPTNKKVVIAYDATTLEEEFVCELYQCITPLFGQERSHILQFVPVPDGVIVHRTNLLEDDMDAVYPPADGTEFGVFETVSPSGSIVATAMYSTRHDLSESGGKWKSTARPILACPRAFTDGKVRFVGVETGAGGAMRIETTTTTLELDSAVDVTGAADNPSMSNVASGADSQYFLHGVTGYEVANIEVISRLDGTGVVMFPAGSGSGTSTPTGWHHLRGGNGSAYFYGLDAVLDYTSDQGSEGGDLGYWEGVRDDAGNNFHFAIYLEGPTALGPMLTKTTDGVFQWQTHYYVSPNPGVPSPSHYHWFPTQPLKILTSGGVHYMVGEQLGYFVDPGTGYESTPSHAEACAVSAADGSLIWTGRHSTDDGSEKLLDAVIVGDYLYVVGEASTYEP